jgi:hypothetical protein
MKLVESGYCQNIVLYVNKYIVKEKQVGFWEVIKNTMTSILIHALHTSLKAIKHTHS